MHKKILIASLAMAALSAYSTASQSLIETYEQALANDPNLAISQLQADAAAQDVITGFSKVLPTVGVDAGYSVMTDPSKLTDESILPDFDTQAISSSIKVSQNLFVLAAFTAYDAVKVNATTKELEVAKAKQDLMVTVAESYIAVLKAKDAMDVSASQVEAVARQQEQTQQRYDVGLVTITDVLDATATLDEAKVALINARSAYDIALQGLFTLTGSVPEGVKNLSPEVPIVAPAESGLQEWIDYAVANHPELVIAEKGLEFGELSLKAMKQNKLPTVVGNASLGYDNVFKANSDAERNWSARVGITMSVNLYSGGSVEADILKAGIGNNITEQQIELLKRSTSVKVSSLYRTVRSDAQNVEAQKQVLKSRESALQATTVGYDVGTRNIVEVLNSQQAAFAAQNNLNNARYDYLLDLLKLKQAAGQLSISDLESIEKYLLD